MVRGHDVVAEAFAQLMRDPLGKPPGVDEHEGRPVLADVRGDAIEHVRHLLRAGDGFELAFGQLDREVEVALVTGVDDLRQRAIAHEQTRDGFDRSLRGREAHATRTRRTTPRAARG